MDHKELAFLLEASESEALYQMHSNASEETKKKCRTEVLRKGIVTAVRTDCFEGFSLNRVVGLGIEDELTQESLDSIIKFYASRNGMFALQLVPSFITPGVEELLKKNGFTFKNNWVRFCRDTSPVGSINCDLEIREAGRQNVKRYGEIVAGVFGFPEESAGLISSVIGLNNWKHFIAVDNEVPAATGSVFFQGDAAWIGFAATLPEYRNRGAQGALLARRIDEAREKGCKWISVETAEDTSERNSPSYRNMLRFGFSLIYTRPNYVKQAGTA